MRYSYFFLYMQKAAYGLRISDWSSDVFSSDLAAGHFRRRNHGGKAHEFVDKLRSPRSGRLGRRQFYSGGKATAGNASAIVRQLMEDQACCTGLVISI